MKEYKTNRLDMIKIMLIMLEHLGQYYAFAAITLHIDLMQMLIALKC